ncbi:MAG: hypothetical protein RSD08_09840, partial [Oscillospiraceae bacterium]
RQSDIQYMKEAIEDIYYSDPREKGIEPLKELLKRMKETKPRWKIDLSGSITQYMYLRHLYEVSEAVKIGEWSLACHEMSDVLIYSKVSGSRGSKLTLINAEKILEDGLKNV